MRSGDKEEGEGGPLCLSQLWDLCTFAKTGPDMKHPKCPDFCPVVNPGELSSSFESGRATG